LVGMAQGRLMFWQLPAENADLPRILGRSGEARESRPPLEVIPADTGVVTTSSERSVSQDDSAPVIGLLRIAAARRAFDELLSSELPALAMAALQAGLETPSVTALACESRPSWANCEKRFAQMLEELGVSPIQTSHQAGRTLALHHAGEIRSGAVTPYEGASRISNLALNFFDDDPFWLTLR
jgi:hypothetical protein